MNFHAPSLQGVTQDEKSHQALFLDAQVLRDLVQAASESRLADERKDVETMSISSPAALLSRTDSLVSTSSFISDSSSDESGCSLGEAKLHHKKPTEELLLAGLERVKLDNKLEEEVKDGALKLAEEARKERLRHQRELRDLANCTHEVSPSGKSFQKNLTRKILRKSGMNSVYRFLKYPFRIFRTHKDCPGYPCAQHTVVVPRKNCIFGGCFTSSTDDTLPQMRSAPRQQTKPVMQFRTVQSTQRDVPAWTMEEYMAKNGRLQNWKRRKDDEEFGGIEGNNLMNQYADNNAMNSYDSDSD